ncbi:MAG: O-antigen ligase family protein [Phenylobacterium sp.]|uniref:O-antigen ligase family protein n=1 Tax=Phenylobacterium sp. TaxID=1871053 RepID=UPI00183A82FD|nr:O-antigen ligase family protein [Phenylobacterium sp.]MBA4794633.1 O-antigen ligase family protein [Phenylobacterium sp.]
MKRVDWPLLLVFALGPIQWVTLLNVGLALKLVHLVMFPMAAYGFAQVLGGPRIVDLPKGTLVFWGAFFAYLFSLVVSLLHSISPTEGFSQIAKMLIYGVMGLGIALYVGTRPRDMILRTLCLAPLVSAGTFLIVANFVLAARGISMMGLVVRALESGNPTVLQFALFLNLFNTPDQIASGDIVSTALRHTALSFIWLGGLAAAVTAMSWTGATASMRVSAVAGVALAATVVILSVSRSLIVATIAASLVLAIAWLSSGRKITLFGVLASSLAIAVVALIAVQGSGVTNIVGQRLGSISEDGRLGMYAEALDAIAQAPVLGRGTGAEVAASTRVGRGVVYHQVHNLFLAAWLQGGILSLSCAATYLFALLAMLGSAVLRARTVPVVGFMAAILTLPILRSQLSGDGGSFTIGEWLCIALFLGLSSSALNSPRRRQTQGSTPPSTSPSRTAPTV